MHCSVAEAKQRLSCAEFAAWKAYRILEPFGEDWDQAAIVAWSVMRANGGSAQIDDFRPPKESAESNKASDFATKLRGALR